MSLGWTNGGERYRGKKQSVGIALAVTSGLENLQQQKERETDREWMKGG